MKRTFCATALALAACTPQPNSSDAGDRCVQPGDLAVNEKGVGLFCTAGGGECEPFLTGFGDKAWICTVDGEPTAEENFCTMPCETDDFCGPNARCVGRARRAGCTPTRCLGEEDLDGGAGDGSDGGDAGDAGDAGAADAGEDGGGSDAADGGSAD